MKRAELNRGDIIASISRGSYRSLNDVYIVLDTDDWHDEYDYVERRNITRRGKAPKHSTKGGTGVLVAILSRPTFQTDGSYDRSHMDTLAKKAMRIKVGDTVESNGIKGIRVVSVGLNLLSENIDDYIENEQRNLAARKKSAEEEKKRRSENETIIAEANDLLVALGGTKTHTWANANLSLDIKGSNVPIVIRALRALKDQEAGK